MVSGYNVIEWGGLGPENHKILIIRPHLLKMTLSTFHAPAPLQIAVTNRQEKLG